tara:strand:- start:135 stop:1481 length:1347 start_codon:yes stop_codon:yes gene_type:complete
MADKMVDKFKNKLPFDFKKKEESKARNDFPGQKLKLSGALLQDSAKTIITLFITLVKMMEKNTHFKFVYYFAINTIYKFIRSLKEIARYSKSAAVPGNKKAAKYLVYLGKLVCINTENLLNIDLLRYVTGKISLALNFYQLDALQDINNLFESVISKMFNFNTEFCRYTSKLELKLAQESLSEGSSEEQGLQSPQKEDNQLSLKDDIESQNNLESNQDSESNQPSESDKIETQEEENYPQATKKYPLLTDNSTAKTYIDLMPRDGYSDRCWTLNKEKDLIKGPCVKGPSKSEFDGNDIDYKKRVGCPVGDERLSYEQYQDCVIRCGYNPKNSQTFKDFQVEPKFNPNEGLVKKIERNKDYLCNEMEFTCPVSLSKMTDEKRKETKKWCSESATEHSPIEMVNIKRGWNKENDDEKKCLDQCKSMKGSDYRFGKDPMWTELVNSIKKKE